MGGHTWHKLVAAQSCATTHWTSGSWCSRPSGGGASWQVWARPWSSWQWLASWWPSSPWSSWQWLASCWPSSTCSSWPSWSSWPLWSPSQWPSSWQLSWPLLPAWQGVWFALGELGGAGHKWLQHTWTCQ